MELSLSLARQFARVFEAGTGQRLGEDRLWRVGAMLTPLCRTLGLTAEQLVARIHANPCDPVVAETIDALLNNETSFFRDGAAFRQIAEDVLPELAERCAAERTIRIWSAACSTGQESYSLAMLFAEDRDRWRGWTIEIMGTDISRAALTRAASGLYSPFEVQRGLPLRQLTAWFDPRNDSPKGEKGWRIKPEIATMVRFNRHNLMGPPPGRQRFDLVLCRNALLYFPDENRSVVLAGIAAAMKPHAALILGAGETASGARGSMMVDPDLLTVFRRTGYTSLGDRHAA